MRRLFIVTLLLLSAAAAAWYFLSKKGYNLKAIVNVPRTMDLSVDCPKLQKMVVTSSVKLTVHNRSSKRYSNVAVRIIALDRYGKLIREKSIDFERTLEGRDSLSKRITLPARARSCECVIESADSE